ncbi:MAG: hypothetical protein U0X76_10660 [Bacteroidia bacterium]
MTKTVFTHLISAKMLTWYDLLSGKIDFTKEEVAEGDSDKPVIEKDTEKHAVKTHHESHGPKTEGAKKATTKTRKKV